MPIFAAIGAYVAGAIGLVGAAAVVVGAIVSVAAAYVVSRLINGNENKGNNSAGGASNQGGRIQVPPATNNKIPVVYGSAFVNGIITDARLITTDDKINDTMFYCIVLSETCQSGTPTYTVGDVYWSDSRLTFNSSNKHKVQDGRKIVENVVVTAGAFVVGTSYHILVPGNTDFTAIGAASNEPGEIFTATGVGTGTGTAREEDFVDTNFVVESKHLVEMRVYAGGSEAADQIFPTSGTQAAYDFWGDDDNSWTTDFDMKGLVYAIVRLTYNGDKGFTSLPNVTFEINNTVNNPANVWLDYMTGERYGANIDAQYIDVTPNTSEWDKWRQYCNEDIVFTDIAGQTTAVANRYTINGVIDTSNQVKTNIDTILQNGGAWMSYNVVSGLWTPLIKKAITAGVSVEPATLFTASRDAANQLTVTAFPNGRIEAGQELYNSTGTFIGTISAQLTPTTGETAGQKGRYTTSTSGTITSTTFYTTTPNLLEFSDDNITSGITISSTRLEDLFNKVEVEFYDKYNRDQKAYSRIDLSGGLRNPNEPDNQLRMSLDLCNNSIQANMLGNMEMRQSRDDLVINFTTSHYGIQTQAGDIIEVTSDLYGWAPKLFRVLRVKEIENEDASLSADIQALEYNGDVYTIEPITEFTTQKNIGIGQYGASPNLPLPPRLIVVKVNPTDPIPNFQLQVQIPLTGGPYDEIELYVTEGWDPFNITGSTASSVATITATDFGAINAGDFFKVNTTAGAFVIGNQYTIVTVGTTNFTLIGASANTVGITFTATGAGSGTGTASNNFTILAQLTNNPVSKTFVSGGAFTPVPVNTVTLNNTTGLIVGNTLTGTGLPVLGAGITAISGSQVTLDTFFTAQAAGTYTVAGGLGTYSIDNAAVVSGTTQLFDLPEATDYSFFKRTTPNGNKATFTNGETITITITELPANSQVYRRWFIKSRMGINKRYGAFSEPSTVDKDGNFQYEPDPAAGSVSVINITQALVKLDFGSFVIANNGLLLFRTMTPVDFGNNNNIGSSAQLDLGLLSVVENTVTSTTTDVEAFVWQVDPT